MSKRSFFYTAFVVAPPFPISRVVDWVGCLENCKWMRDDRRPERGCANGSITDQTKTTTVWSNNSTTIVNGLPLSGAPSARWSTTLPGRAVPDHVVCNLTAMSRVFRPLPSRYFVCRLNRLLCDLLRNRGGTPRHGVVLDLCSRVPARFGTGQTRGRVSR